MPETTATIASEGAPFAIAKLARIPVKAPVGPTILNLLPPKIAAISPAQIAVTIPTTGVVCEATASEIERGIDTNETVSPAFQLTFICETIVERFMNLLL